MGLSVDELDAFAERVRRLRDCGVLFEGLLTCADPRFPASVEDASALAMVARLVLNQHVNQRSLDEMAGTVSRSSWNNVGAAISRAFTDYQHAANDAAIRSGDGGGGDGDSNSDGGGGETEEAVLAMADALEREGFDPSGDVDAFLESLDDGGQVHSSHVRSQRGDYCSSIA